jgi:hypothetical protein
MKKVFLLLASFLFAQAFYGQNDTIPGEAEYRKHYDCRYTEGNILIIQKKGKQITDYMPSKPTKAGFVMRMEAIYDLEFTDGKRYKSSIIKAISQDSITISSAFNEKCAVREGKKYELITYPVTSIKIARFINDRSLGFFEKKKIDDSYELIVKTVDKAKMCPAVLTFTKRNNEVKVCHYYLTSQGYDILFETDGILDYMEYNVDWR